VMTKTFLKIR